MTTIMAIKLAGAGVHFIINMLRFFRGMKNDDLADSHL